MLGPTELPFAVAGHRVLILEKPAKSKTEGGLHIPESAQMRYFSGILLDAGLPARDKIHDQGYEIGDEVMFGMYAGLKEAWDHVVEGDPDAVDEKSPWRFDSDESNNVCRVYRCAKTGAVRKIETVIVLNVDDLIASNQLAARIRTGDLEIVRGVTAEGKTQHIFQRRATDEDVSEVPGSLQEQIATQLRGDANGHA